LFQTERRLEFLIDSGNAKPIGIAAVVATFNTRRLISYHVKIKRSLDPGLMIVR
jgi:hypothetical protein